MSDCKPFFFICSSTVVFLPPNLFRNYSVYPSWTKPELEPELSCNKIVPTQCDSRAAQKPAVVSFGLGFLGGQWFPAQMPWYSTGSAKVLLANLYEEISKCLCRYQAKSVTDVSEGKLIHTKPLSVYFPPLLLSGFFHYPVYPRPHYPG